MVFSRSNTLKIFASKKHLIWHLRAVAGSARGGSNSQPGLVFKKVGTFSSAICCATVSTVKDDPRQIIKVDMYTQNTMAILEAEAVVSHGMQPDGQLASANTGTVAMLGTNDRLVAALRGSAARYESPRASYPQGIAATLQAHAGS
jgi:hypothetical protein